MDFLRRESSLEALSFITASPGARNSEWPRTPSSARSAAAEDRRGNPLLSLASAAGIIDGPREKQSSAESARRGGSKVKYEGQEEDSRPPHVYRMNSTDALLRAVGEAQPASDDSDSDEPAVGSAFPKPDRVYFRELHLHYSAMLMWLAPTMVLRACLKWTTNSRLRKSIRITTSIQLTTTANHPITDKVLLTKKCASSPPPPLGLPLPPMPRRCLRVLDLTTLQS